MTESVFRCGSTTGPIIGVPRTEALTAARREPLCAVCVMLGPTDCTRRIGPNAAQRERGERGTGGGGGGGGDCSVLQCNASQCHHRKGCDSGLQWHVEMFQCAMLTHTHITHTHTHTRQNENDSTTFEKSRLKTGLHSVVALPVDHVSLTSATPLMKSGLSFFDHRPRGQSSLLAANAFGNTETIGKPKDLFLCRIPRTGWTSGL